jgi:hypothetical protein
MQTMTVTTPEPAPAVQRLTTGQRWMLVGLAVASGALAGMSFAGMFQAVKAAMIPFFGRDAWMIPVGTDLGIIITSLFGVFLEVVDMPLRSLRWVTLAFLGLQLGLNIGSAHGNLLGSVGHAVLPLAFITVIEVWLFTTRKHRKRRSAHSRRRVPLRRYLADYAGSREISQWMHLWDVSYETAIDMLQRKRLAESHLRIIYGDRWKTETPADLLHMLNTPKYLDEAIADIGKKRGVFDKNAKPGGNSDRKHRQPVNDDAGAGKTSANPVMPHSDCGCTAHKAISAGKILPLETPNGDGTTDPIGNAEIVNAEHILFHANPIGADNLRLLFKLGTPNARKLRDDLKARRESGSGSGRESGGQSGRPGSAGVGQGVGPGDGG